MTTELRPPTAGTARLLMIVAAAVVLVLWQLPYGPQILYPFTLLATYAHEMGHGLTALLLGGQFERLMIYPDGSGLAYSGTDGSRISRALVAAGGLLGPTVAGAVLLVLSRRPKRGRWLLAAVALGLGLSALFFVRNLFGWAFVVLAALSIGAIARFVPRLAPFTAQLLAVVLCMAVFRDLDYMFSPGGTVDGVQHRSDSATIADALFLPYWFWGGLVAATSFGVLAVGTYLALRPPKERAVAER